MDRRRWLERVEAELAGRGLPAGVRERLLAELRDHLDDLTEGRGEMDADWEQRMGSPGELAAAAAAAHRRSGWVRRHPLVVFGLAPVPAMLLAVTCYVFVFPVLGYAIGAAVGADGEVPPAGFARSAADVFFYGVAFVPFLGVAAALGWLAVRSGSPRWWAAAAVAQVAAVAGLLRVQSTWGDLPEQTQLLLAIGTPLAGWRQAAQMLLPLALGWLVLRRRRAQPCALAG